MVGNPRCEYPVQCREQPALLGLQRRSVVDGASGWLSHAALPDIQAGAWPQLQNRRSIQVTMRTLLSVGSPEDRGVGLWRGPKLTGIGQGKSRRRIKIPTQNQ